MPIRLENTRFGDIEVDDDRILQFPQGLIGYPNESRFVLLPTGQRIAWLQSLTTSSLAFPVIEGSELGDNYPTPSAASLASSHGVESDDLVVLIVVVVREGGADLEANLLAPIVIDFERRSGFQAVLDPRHYGARHLLSVAPPPASHDSVTLAPAAVTMRVAG